MRRLRADKVLAVVSARAGERVDPGWARFAGGDSRVTRVRLGGLSPGDLTELASALGLGVLSQRGASRLAAHTGGNALYCRALLDEIGIAALSTAGSRGLPAPRELSAVILARVAALPATAQSFLAAASVLGQHAPIPVIVSIARLPDARNEVDAAVAAGLLTEADSALELAFTHPLFRAAIYADLSPASRRELHARAAEVVAGRGRLAHLAAAALGPDEALAGELEASAQAAAAAGDADASAWALEQAAALSPGQARETRLLDAAVVLLNAADTPSAARVLASCQASSARRDALTGLLGVFTGSPGAEGRLLAAWQAHDPQAEREIGARAATSLTNWMVLSGRPDEALTWADRAVGSTAPGSVLRALAHTAQAYAFAAASRAPEGLAVLGFLPVSGNEVPMAETDALIMRGMLKVYVDDLPGAIADLGVAAARLRTGLPATYPGPCLAHLSDAHFRRGDWDAAVTHAQLATSLAQDTDRPLDLARAHARIAQVLAFRGQWPAAQAHVSAARAATERFPVVLAVATAAVASASLAFARGDLAGVLAATEPVRATGLLGVGGRLGIFNWRGLLTAASPAFRSAVTSTLAALPRGKAESYASYWSTGSRQFVSASGHQTYAVIELAGSSDTARQDSYDAIKAQLGAPGLQTQLGGVVPTDETIDQQTTANITRAEALSFPILLILLLVIFGSMTAASLPLAIGALGILGSFTALRLLTLVTGVSVFSLNITTILGLGLGIDYGLFLVTRFREELHKQGTVEEAVARTVTTAGRTILVSGVTVAIVLASLMLFPETILRSIGYGGVATVLVDMIAALTVLPALLAVLGPKVNSLRIRRSVRRPPAAEASGGWYRLAHGVMRRPVLYAVPIVVLLLGLGSPFLHVVWGGVDATALPSSTAPRIVTEALNRDFPGNPTAPIEAIVQFRGLVAGSPARAAGLASYTSRLDRVPGVIAAQVTGIRGDVARIDLSYGPGPYTPQARAIAGDVRDVAAPSGATVQVGGQTAALADELSSIGDTLPWMALAVVLATFVLLFLAFGSLVLPVEAIAANILSLSAMYGVVTWIFQDGHLSGLLGFTPNGTISPTIPVLMFAIMFGLSMDYEVFLLSRIREKYVATGDNTAAIASGLQRTGGVITSAALLLVIVIGMFSLSSITFIKLLGVGMIVALILDATLVRVLLVPATMRLLGDANWWAPAPMRRLYARYGIREDEVPGPGTVAESEPQPARA